MKPYFVPFQQMNHTQKVQQAINYLKGRNKYALEENSLFEYVPASKQEELGIVWVREGKWTA